MSDQKQSLFERLNAPFPYSEYRYDSFGDHCYISGQAVTERINKVLGVVFGSVVDYMIRRKSS